VHCPRDVPLTCRVVKETCSTLWQ